MTLPKSRTPQRHDRARTHSTSKPASCRIKPTSSKCVIANTETPPAEREFASSEQVGESDLS